MLYFYYGTDTEAARKKAHVTIDALLVKKPDATLILLGSEEISESKIAELVGGQALFASKYIVYVSGAFENKENKERLLKQIKDIAASENIFIFAEGKMDKASFVKIEKAAEKVQEFEEKEKAAKKKEGIEFFTFADAFGKRDKRSLWIMYQDALAADSAAEEVHSILFWQIKSMLLAKKCKTADEAGMKAFPFSKSREYARNYKDGELEKISADLVSMYHEAHRGNLDFHIALEKFILGL